MRFLFVSDFEPDRHSGAAGTLLALADALRDQDHTVDLAWKSPSSRRAAGTLGRLFTLPRRQLLQTAHRLDGADRPYDAVIVSQPYAYLVYERLRPRHPGTLFLNRTHGWEARLYESHLRFRWDHASALRRLATRAMAGLTGRACRRTARSAHGIIAPSTRCAEDIRRRYPDAAHRVAVIPYGRDDAAAGEDQDERPAGSRLLFVGGYLPIKGAGVLEAVLPTVGRRHPTTRLTLVVDRGARDRVESVFRPSWGDRLTVHAWLPRDALHRVYATHDILLFPSLFEGFGKVWLEAMAAGLCVVGFAEGGLPDHATHEREALVCPTGDVEELGHLVRRAIDDPATARTLGSRARARVNDLTWDRTAEQTVAFCRRLAAGGTP